MSNQHLVFSPRYNTNLSEFGIDKPFALDRGEMVLAELSRRFGRQSAEYEVPEPISLADIRLVHTQDYLDSLSDPQTWLQIFEFTEKEYFPDQAQRPLPELLNDLRLKSGGTLLAARFAMDSGLAANLGGGYHHAFPDRGHGYCVLHDIAISIRRLQKDARIKRALIVDLDFHQGDGSAVIFKGEEEVFTLSLHSQEGWPEHKQESDLDVPIYQGEEHLYLEKLEEALTTALRRFAPDMVVFIAGSDPYEKDVLPGTAFLKMTLEQLRQRDEFVIDSFADLGIPLVSVFAGGYGPDVWQVHYNATKHLLERSGILVGSTQTH
jgi:acetoin utilization deacetylase AcuC-like enzyme